MFDQIENHPRFKQLNAGVNEDGELIDREVVTYVAHPMANFFPDQFEHRVDHENRFIGVIIDNGGTDIEVRLPFEVIEQMAGWIKAGPVSPTEGSASTEEGIDERQRENLSGSGVHPAVHDQRHGSESRRRLSR